MFDLLFLVVVGLSTAFAAMRGGLRELSTLLALGIAGAVTLLLLNPVLALTGQAGSFFGTAAVAIALIGVFFLLAQIGLHIGIKKIPLKGKAATYDRIGGGVFGLLRGLALAGLAYLGYSYQIDEARQPDTVRNAMTRPIAAGVANIFESFAPATTELDQPETDESAEPSADVSGYDRGDRNGLSEIMTTVTTTDDAQLGQRAGAQSATSDDEDPIADILDEDQN